MKIATYNFRFGGKASERIHLWNQIFTVVNPDIFLVQEMCHPEKYMSSQYDTYRNQIHWIKAGENNWGTAVFVRSGKIKPIIIYFCNKKIDWVRGTITKLSTQPNQSMNKPKLHGLRHYYWKVWIVANP